LSGIMSALNNPTLLALIGTIFGGVGLKLLESLLGKKKVQSDEAAAIRAELRTDVNSLRQTIKDEKISTDKWRAEYYKTLEECYDTKRQVTEVKARVIELEEEVSVWREKYYQLWQDMAIERDAEDDSPILPHGDSMQAVDASPR
jgi:chromosome segregation ATPase